MKRFVGLISSLLGIAFIIGLVLFLSEREHIKERTIAYLSRQLEKHTGWEVDFQKVEFTLPLTLKMERMVVAQGGQTILVATEVAFSINPWELASQRILFEKGHIGSLLLLGKWQENGGANEAPSFEGGVEALFTTEENAVPFGLSISNLVIDRFSVAPEFLSAHGAEKFSFLTTPLTLRSNLEINPVKQEMLLALDLTQNGLPEIKSSLSMQKAESGWQGLFRCDLPRNNMFASSIPFNHQIDYILEMHLSLNRSFQIQKGELEVVYQKESEPVESSFGIEEQLFGRYGNVKTVFMIDQKEQVHFSMLNAVVGSCFFEGHGEYEISTGLFDIHFFCAQNSESLLLDQFSIDLKRPRVAAHLQGSFAELHCDIDLETEALLYREHLFEGLFVSLNGALKEQVFDGKFFLKSFYQDLPLTLASSLVVKQNQEVEVKEAVFAYGSNTIEGSFSYSPAKPFVVGHAMGEMNLASFNPILSSNLEGALHFECGLYGSEEGGQVVDCSLQAPHLATEWAFLEQFHLFVKGADFSKRAIAAVELSCARIKGQELDLADLLFKSEMASKEPLWPYTLSLRSGKEGEFDLASKGTWSYRQEQLKVVVESLKGNLAAYPYHLEEQVAFFFDKEECFFSPVHLRLQESFLSASCERLENQLRSIVKIENLPLAVLESFDPTFPLRGVLNLDFDLFESGRELMGDMRVSVKEIEWREEQFNLPVSPDLEFDAHLADNRLTCLGHISGFGSHPFELSADIPLRLNLHPFEVELLKDQQLQLAAKIEGKIESLLELFAPSTPLILNGEVALELNMSGLVGALEYHGKGEIKNLAYEEPDVGLALKGGSAHLEIVDKKVLLSDLRAIADGEGVVTGSGELEINPEKAFPFAVDFQVSKVPIAPQDYISAIVNGHLLFKGDTEKATLEGKGVTEVVEIAVPDTVPELVHVVDVTYVNQPENKDAPTVYKKDNSDWPLSFNIEIEIPAKAYITGTDWESEWKGNLVFGGNSDALLVNGSCTIKRGEYNFNGKAFQINQGTITFAGDLDKKTSIYVIASRDLDAILAEVIVKGSMNNPSIVFRSNPPLPQREILSWILFNRGTSEINSFQGTQLNESITNLSAKRGNGGADVLTKFREKIGIDRLDISREGGDSNEVSVQVGKYISRGILVSVNRSITAETNRVAIEAALMKHVKVQAEIGDDADAQLLLKWKKDY